MYARLVTFRVAPGHRKEMERLADESRRYMEMAHGYRRSEFFSNERAHEYGALSVWDSLKDIDRATSTLDPRLHEVLKGISEAPPVIHTYEVYEEA